MVFLTVRTTITLSPSLGLLILAGNFLILFGVLVNILGRIGVLEGKISRLLIIFIRPQDLTRFKSGLTLWWRVSPSFSGVQSKHSFRGRLFFYRWLFIWEVFDLFFFTFLKEDSRTLHFSIVIRLGVNKLKFDLSNGCVGIYLISRSVQLLLSFQNPLNSSLPLNISPWFTNFLPNIIWFSLRFFREFEILFLLYIFLCWRVDSGSNGRLLRLYYCSSRL